MNGKEIYEKIKHIPEDSSFWPDNIDTVYMLASQLPVWSSVLEIGTWYWRSASAWALSTGWRVTALDICERTHKIAQDFMDDLELNVHMILWDSHDIEIEEDFDIVWIDWDHSYESCMNDLITFFPRARLLICWHDYHSSWPWVIKAVDEFFWLKEIKKDWNIWYYFKK